jgi:uncharacterized protein
MRRLVLEKRREMYHPDSLPFLCAVTNLDLDLTDDCNMRCVYCFKGEKTPRRITMEIAQDVVLWLIKASRGFSNINLNFMGGEPLMEWDIVRELVPWARNRAKVHGKLLSFSMTTNLTLMTQEIRDFFDQWGFGVMMSIDGMPEVQDSQRPLRDGTKGSPIVERWARSMLKTRPRSQARMTVHSSNIQHLLESVVYLKNEVGFQGFVIAPSDVVSWNAGIRDKFAEQFHLLADYVIKSYMENSPVDVAVIDYYCKEYFYPTKIGQSIEPKKASCGAGKGYLMADFEGSLWGCHRFDGSCTAAGVGHELSFGNIYKPGFRNDLHQAFLDFDHQKIHKSTCAGCVVAPVCGGSCPAANLEETASLYLAHDARCWFGRLTFQESQRVFDALWDAQCESFLKTVKEESD